MTALLSSSLANFTLAELLDAVRRSICFSSFSLALTAAIFASVSFLYSDSNFSTDVKSCLFLSAILPIVALRLLFFASRPSTMSSVLARAEASSFSLPSRSIWVFSSFSLAVASSLIRDSSESFWFFAISETRSKFVWCCFDRLLSSARNSRLSLVSATCFSFSESIVF